MKPAPLRWTGRIRWLLLMLVLAVALSVLAWIGWRDYHRFTQLALGSEHVVHFERGMRLKDLAAQLRQDGVSAAPYWQWRLLAEQMRVSKSLKAGEYRISPEATPRALLQAIVDGRVVQYRITIIEGSRFSELRSSVAKHAQLEQTLGGLSDVQVLERIGATESHAEGLFLPDTYFFPRGFSDLDLLKRAYWAQKSLLDQAWQKRTKDLPLANAYQALTLASIIEKETGQSGERAEIGGVFVNRLRQGWRLQTDPTVIYGMGAAYDGNIRRTDLETDNPYNTYTRFGLPPTPIALPGKAAILAATQPLLTESMYFVARGDGSHVFSRTLDDHNAAVRRFQLGQP